MPPSEPPATAASRAMPSSRQERALRAHHVGDRDHGEVRAVRPAGRGIERRRPGRAAAAAEQIGADDEVAIGVERLAGADHAVPPAEAAAAIGVAAVRVAILGGETVARAGRRGRAPSSPPRARRRRARGRRGSRCRARARACRRFRTRCVTGWRLAAAVERERAAAGRGTASRRCRRILPRRRWLASCAGHTSPASYAAGAT